MLQIPILVLSILMLTIIILKLQTFMPPFQKSELISVMLFTLGFNSWCFNFYSAAYPSLELIETYINQAIANIHFVIMYPLSLIWVLRYFKLKRHFIFCFGLAFLWLSGYEVLLFGDVYFGIFKIEGSYGVPLSITTLYNTVTILLAIYFLRKFEWILIKEKT
ncbi:hypothetical protein ASG85_05385 [Paenibacillus sp. Soil724D2]|nr:hypothetical protein ASG85_05385 [Paenibacillus sp. Soil724D2]